MRSPMKWTIWNRVYVAAFLLYGGLLWFVSTTVFLAAIKQHARLTLSEIVLQSLMTIFLPISILGIWKPWIASVLLLAAAAADLTLVLLMHIHSAGNTTGIFNSSLLFLGVPTLATALLYQLLARTASPART